MPELRDIERQIDETRNAMDETIDAIADKVNVRQIGHRTLEAVKRRAPEIPAGSHRFYARRPLLVGTAVLALGTGVGLMFSPAGGRSDVSPSALSRRMGAMKERAKAAVGDLRQHATEMKERATDTVEEVREKAKNEAHRAKEKAAETVDEVREKAKHETDVMKAVTTQKIGTAKAKAAENVEQAKDKVQGMMDKK